MPLRYLHASAPETRDPFGQAVLGLLCWAAFTGGSLAAETVDCALVAPKYQARDGQVSLEMTLDCATADGTWQIPLETDLLVGLTVYEASGANVDANETEEHANWYDRLTDWYYRWTSPPRRTLLADRNVEAALGAGTQSKAALVAGKPKWIILRDADHDSFDFPAQPIQVKGKGERLALTFQASEKDLAGKDHFLLALWPASARRACDQSSPYSRSGCRRDGYVIGDDAGVEPLAAYPGLEIDQGDNAVDSIGESWIVERFR